MSYFKRFIWSLLFVLTPFLVQAQSSSTGNTQFDAMVNEQMSEFMVRDYWQKPALLLELMDIQPAETVADLGCGTGYFSLKLAEQVGPDGKVIALDIDMAKLNKLKLIKRYAGVGQLEIIQNNPGDLKVADSSLDKIVVLNAYHEIKEIETVLAQCLKALKPGGKVFVIDKVSDKMDNDKVSRKKLVKNEFIRRSFVEEELTSAGFNVTEVKDKYIENEKAEATRKTNWFVVIAAKK